MIHSQIYVDAQMTFKYNLYSAKEWTIYGYNLYAKNY